MKINLGAEAKISVENNLIVKERIKKKYRTDELDDKIRKLRTRKEAKLIAKANPISPKLISVDDVGMKIVMEYIKGDLLTYLFDKLDTKNKKRLFTDIGKNIANLHDKEIIHGDLTTSNMIVDKNSKIFFIDFGLGFTSHKIEDKTVDLHLFKQVLFNYHNCEECFVNVLIGYKKSKDYDDVIERLKTVEGRGRYK